MSFGSRHVVPFYVVAALMGAVSPWATAIAQTETAPPTGEAQTLPATGEAQTFPATGEAQPAPANAMPALSPPGDGVTLASEQPPAPSSEPSSGTSTGTITSNEPEAPARSAAPSAEPVSTAPASAVAAPLLPPAAAADPIPPTPPVVPTLTVDVPAALARITDAKTYAKRDRDGLVAAYAARQGRPIWMTTKGATPEARSLAAEIVKARDWGLALPDLDAAVLAPVSRDGADLAPDVIADAEVRLSLATLLYARQARGGRFQPKDVTPYLDRTAPLYEPESVLAQIASAAQPDGYLRQLHPQHPQFERLRQRYLAVRDEPAPAKGPSEADRILANMEQWRWMPSDLGAFHVWANVPEQILRVVRDGRVIHTERIVVGKANAQTPIFSHEMEHVIFHPFWGVPDSIKINEILPGLKRGKPILARQNLRLQLNGKDVDPSRFDWNRTDIRRFHVYQPPSRGNALGIVKFMFPNKHAVYMHDTPSKSLFKASVRTFSHGCIRVQDPVTFAELLLGEDRGMSASQVRALAKPGARENNQINLSRHIPVHMVYFTRWVGDDGKLAAFKDIYGHEERIRLALAGKMNLIKPVPEPKVPTDPIGSLVEASSPSSGEGPRGRRNNRYSDGGPPVSFNATRPAWAKRIFSDGGSFSGGN